MVTTTTLLCSKFSPHCVRVIDSLRKLNIQPENHMKVLWIDHPNVRSYLKDTGVKSVPCIIVHDEDRDISIIYEKERFSDYLNNFIQQRQSRVGSTVQAPVAPHMAAMSGNPAFVQQHQNFLSTQNQMMNTLQKSQADLALHQVQSPASIPSSQAIRTSLSKQIFGTEEPPKTTGGVPSGMRQMGQNIISSLQQKQEEKKAFLSQELLRQKEISRKEAESLIQKTQQDSELQKQQARQQYEASRQQDENLRFMTIASELRKEYKDLSDSDIQVLAKSEMINFQIAELDQAQARLSNMKQMHSSNQAAVSEIDKDLVTVSQAKQQLAQMRMQLPQVVLPNKNPNPLQDDPVNRARNIEILNQQIQADPTNEMLKQKLSSLQKENYVNLQQDKLNTDLNVAKKSQMKNGITSIDTLLGDEEETLYDLATKRKGTDFHQSEAQVNTALSSTKRNSINQKVREMSQTRPITVDKGMGHEVMAQSSLPVIPDKKVEFTPIDVIDSVEEAFGGDMIDSAEEEEQQPIVTVKKKKASALDMAREMEKSRGAIEKEFERR